MIYVIEELWTDPMENDRSLAMGYKPIGYVTHEDAAKIKCADKFVEGAGWPIERGQRRPMFRYYRLDPVSF